MQEKRIAIMGAGSIGTILGALLTRSGVEVDLIDSYAAHVDALRTCGATVVGNLELNVPVTAYTPDNLEGVYDIVFLLCKQTGTREALEQLMPHLHGESVVCTLQNGLPEPRVAEIIGRERTMGGIVLFGATWEAPGVSRCTSTAEHMAKGVLLELGELDGGITPRLLELRSILSKAVNCTVSDSLMGLRWLKILINATSSGMSAALGCEFGWYLDRDDAMLALAMVGDETIRVAHAEGVRMPGAGQSDSYEYFEIKPGETAWDKIEAYRAIWNVTARELKASMLQDLEKGRPCEIDFINGEVIDRGRRHGIPTPYNDTLAALVKLAQAHGQVWQPEEALPFFQALLTASGIPAERP